MTEPNDKIREFGELYERHHKHLYNIAKRFIGRNNQVDPNDLINEAAIKVMAAFKERPIDNFVQFFATTMQRTLWASVRERSGERAIEGMEGMEIVDTNTPSPSSQAEDAEIPLVGARILGLMGQVSPEHREAVALSMKGIPYSEIAKTLGIKPATVKTRIHRGKQELKAIVAANGISI